MYNLKKTNSVGIVLLSCVYFFFSFLLYIYPMNTLQECILQETTSETSVGRGRQMPRARRGDQISRLQQTGERESGRW